MIQSISYNLTDKESTLLKVSTKLFEGSYKFNSFIESSGIRSLIDPGSHEYKLDLSGFPKTKEGEIQKIWYKLLYIMSAFHNHIDFKALIHENVKKMILRYRDYEEGVKRALAEYILFLRTGSRTCYDLHHELVENMTIDEMVDLLEKELSLRTSFYRKNNHKDIIVEVATIHYDYDELYEEYGIDKTRDYNSEDEDYPIYEKYIKYITTTEHTEHLICHRQMIASMYAK